VLVLASLEGEETLFEVVRRDEPEAHRGVGTSR
jgi:hypothetical protein